MDSPKKCPVGTQRYWESTAQFWVKTHDNTIFDDSVGAWIPVPKTPTEFSELFTDLNRIGARINDYKEPVDGDVWLIKSLEEFKTESGKDFSPNIFKQFSGKWKDSSSLTYNFRWALEKMLHASDIEKNEYAAKRLVEENEKIRVEKLKGGERASEGVIYLDKEEIKDIRSRAREEYKYIGDPLTIQDVKELHGEINKILTYLEQGENFSGQQEIDYNEIKTIIDSLRFGPYQRLNIISGMRNRVTELLDISFSDNFGITQSVKKKIQEAYSNFINKYAEKIRNDSIKDFENEIGCSIFETDSVKFYDAIESSPKFLNTKVKTLDDYIGKDLPQLVNGNKSVTFSFEHGEPYPVNQAILVKQGDDSYLAEYEYNGEKRRTYLLEYEQEKILKYYKSQDSTQSANDLFDISMKVRFEKMYNKTFTGEYDTGMLPLFKTVENCIRYLPDGHLKTNDHIKGFARNTLYSQNYDSYAHWSSNDKQIFLSDQAMGFTDKKADIHSGEEFASVVIHETGHGVSDKLGRRGSRLYKDFVVECGWSWEQFPGTTNYRATGKDDDIQRAGRNSNIPLISSYAHKSPEEAFAETYSFYSQYKAKIDKYLETGDDSVFKEKPILNFKITKNSPSYSSTIVSDKFIDIGFNKDLLETILVNKKRDESAHIKSSVLSPTAELKYHSDTNGKLDNNKMAYALKQNRKNEYPVPIFTIVDAKGNHYLPTETPESEVYTHFSNKYLRRATPTFSISEECYDILKGQGVSHAEIESFVFFKCKDTKISKGTPETTTIEKGLPYSMDIVSSSVLVRNKDIFKQMKKIWESDELKKALNDLFEESSDIEEIQKSDKPLLFGDLVNKLKQLLGQKKDFAVNKKPKIQEYCDSIVYNELGQILILKRCHFDDFEPGKWSLPGGKKEEGETYLEGSMRELIEETNIEINPLYAPSEENFIRCPNEDGSVSYYFCYCIDHLNHQYNQVVIDVEEHCDYKWVFPTELKDYDFLLEMNERLPILLIEFDVPGCMDYDASTESDDDIEKLSYEEFIAEIKRSFDDDFLSDDEYLVLQKAFVPGKLVKKMIVDKTGKKTTKWIKPEDVDKERDTDKEEVKNQLKKKKHTYKELSHYAKRSPETILKKVVSESTNPSHRKAAHDELDRRSRLEQVQKKEDKPLKK